MILQFADSELAGLTHRSDGALLLRFAAARVLLEEGPAWARGLTLVLEGAQGPDCDEFGAIENGQVRQGEQRWRAWDAANAAAGEVLVELQFRRGGAWCWQGSALRLLDPGQISDDLSC